MTQSIRDRMKLSSFNFSSAMRLVAAQPTPAGHGVEDAVDAIDYCVQDPGWLWGGRKQRLPEGGRRRPYKTSWRLGEWLPLELGGGLGEPGGQGE